MSDSNPATPLEKNDFYDVLYRRRDVRAEFTGEPVDPVTVARLLTAAHAAPSVGLSQPWDFILVSDSNLRQQFERHVRKEQATFAATLHGEAARRFEKIKIDGILESSLSIVVTYDADRGGPNVLGRHAIADAGLYSTCLAIENLWLSCTFEGWGLGWVSFYREAFLRELLSIPITVRPIAWLCIGPVSLLQSVPDLERQGWSQRRDLRQVLHLDSWVSAGCDEIFASEVGSIGGAVNRAER